MDGKRTPFLNGEHFLDALSRHNLEFCEQTWITNLAALAPDAPSSFVVGLVEFLLSKHQRLFSNEHIGNDSGKRSEMEVAKVAPPQDDLESSPVSLEHFAFQTMTVDPQPHNRSVTTYLHEAPLSLTRIFYQLRRHLFLLPLILFLLHHFFTLSSHLPLSLSLFLPVFLSLSLSVFLSLRFSFS